jgi:hypothetical protein
LQFVLIFGTQGSYPTGFLFGIGYRSLTDNLCIWQEIIWHCCQNNHLFQNKWPKRPTHATYASDKWSSILQFVHNLFWLKLKWNARSKLFYFIIYRSSMLWCSSRTLTKLKSQSQKHFNERKYQYLKYKNKNHSGPDTLKLSDINLAPNLNLSFVQNTIEDLI